VELLTPQSDHEAGAAASTMMAVVTTGNGGYDKREYRSVPVPEAGPATRAQTSSSSAAATWWRRWARSVDVVVDNVAQREAPP
jgi:hypothetical protein